MTIVEQPIEDAGGYAFDRERTGMPSVLHLDPVTSEAVRNILESRDPLNVVTIDSSDPLAIQHTVTRDEEIVARWVEAPQTKPAQSLAEQIFRRQDDIVKAADDPDVATNAQTVLAKTYNNPELDAVDAFRRGSGEKLRGFGIRDELVEVVYLTSIANEAKRRNDEYEARKAAENAHEVQS